MLVGCTAYCSRKVLNPFHNIKEDVGIRSSGIVIGEIPVVVIVCELEHIDTPRHNLMVHISHVLSMFDPVNLTTKLVPHRELCNTRS